MVDVAICDFETYSPVNLPKHGSFVYLEHPQAKVLIGSYAIGDGPVGRWELGEPCPDDLRAHIEAGGTIKAFNAGFETRCFEWLAANAGWPMPSYEQFACTMATALAMALPQSLDRLGEALDLPVKKDKEGARLMRMFSIQDRNGRVKLLRDHPDEAEAYKRYCDLDVDSERAADQLLVPLSADEQDVWLLSEKINRRGLRIDIKSARAAVKLAERAKAKLDREMAEVTGGSVRKVSEVGKLVAWCKEQGVMLTGGAKDILETALESPDLPAHVRKALELRLEGGKTSVKKIEGFLNRASADGRVRGCYTYHGASTGRWTSTGVNVSNLPRTRGIYDDAHLNTQTLFRAIRTEDPDILLALYGDDLGRPMHLLSDAVRGFIMAAPGHEFVQADYSGIEGAVAAFLADEKWKLKAMHEIIADPSIPDMYRQTAAGILGLPLDEVTKRHWSRQAVGKPAELALGFGGSVSAFGTMARLYRVDLDGLHAPIWDKTDPELQEKAAKRFRFSFARNQGGARNMSQNAWMACYVIVQGWREQNSAIAGAWQDMESAARQAILDPGSVHSAARCRLTCRLGYLWMQLPSGRVLCFPSPKLSAQVWVKVKTEDGGYADAEVMDRAEAEKLASRGLAQVQGDTSPGISYLGTDPKTKRFVRKRTYGGDLFQSCLSADTEVLTPYGWKAITDISETDLLWDGDQWVMHGGLVYQGRRATINMAGLRLTPEHKVWTNEGWKAAEVTSVIEATAASSGGKLEGAALRAFTCGRVGRLGRQENALVGHLRLRGPADLRRLGTAERQDHELRLPFGRESERPNAAPWDVPAPHLCGMGQYDGSLLSACGERLAQLRGAGHNGLREVARAGQLLCGHVADIPAGAVAGTNRQRERLQPRELPVGDPARAGAKHQEQSGHRHAPGAYACRRGVRGVRDWGDDTPLPDRSGMADFRTVPPARPYEPNVTEPVFDILNAGPRHRFTVRTDAGPIIVSNCVQATARDLLVNGMRKAEAAGYPIVLHTYDEMLCEVPRGFGDLAEFERLICELPEWAEGLPLAAGGYRSKRYKKD